MPYKFPFSALFTQHVFYKKKLISSLACFSNFLCLLVKYRIVGVLAARNITLSCSKLVKQHRSDKTFEALLFH